MRGIFETRPGSGYNDDSDRYHVANRSLEKAQRCVGDWIIYREPRRGGGREGYVAVAKVERLEPDRTIRDHWYAIMSGYLEFDAVVPLRNEQEFYEPYLAALAAPSKLGAALQGRSVRNIEDVVFDKILRDGFRETLSPSNVVRLGLDLKEVGPEIADFLYLPEADQQRRIVDFIQKRAFRDAAFRNKVLKAYDDRCAFTGLRIIDSDGRVEAQAAHIWSVAGGGSDVVQNGFAGTSTIHWLFDRHLISLTEDYAILAAHSLIPENLRRLFARQSDRILLPSDTLLWPHKPFVQRHRAAFMAKHGGRHGVASGKD